VHHPTAGVAPPALLGELGLGVLHLLLDLLELLQHLIRVEATTTGVATTTPAHLLPLSSPGRPARFTACGCLSPKSLLGLAPAGTRAPRPSFLGSRPAARLGVVGPLLDEL